MNSKKSGSKKEKISRFRQEEGILKVRLPALKDPEGDFVPDYLPPIVDAHVHLFPDHLFVSIWQWFEQYGWPVRYQLTSPQIIDFLLSRGIYHIVALHYAHKPGVARKLNDYMATLCRSHPRITGMATVFPGEADATDILKEAFQKGLCGVKLHSHVQCFDMNSEAMHAIYQICLRYDKPLIMHVGREPKSPAYPCDPYELCATDKLEPVLNAYPGLRICVPHLGADEFEAYQRLLERYDNLWLDTTMTLAEYLPIQQLPNIAEFRSDRIMFGTDFPNLPYAWDREIKNLCRLKLSEDSLARILGQNAATFYSISSYQQTSAVESNNAAESNPQ